MQPAVPVIDERLRFDVHGVVQGVGFRPFVHRLATSLGLWGFVGNDASRVFVEVQGPRTALEEFRRRLGSDAPPLASIEHIETVTVRAEDRPEPTNGGSGFSIVPSTHGPGDVTLVPPDTALCADCVRELHDPTNRRFRHAFITCTNCGPRFTVITALPYDRPVTTMAEFPMCARCAAEYDDVSDRRFHAQPLCCHECGPSPRLVEGSRRACATEAPAVDDRAPEAGDRFGGSAVDRAVELLAAGAVLAVKGLGGYHLVCDATNANAVAALRRRKDRGDKPFAVMVRDLVTARRMGVLDDGEAHVLASPANPIVLVLARRDSPLAPEVAPGNPLVGLVLPSSGLHHLLLDHARGLDALVMTSGNRSGEPIAHRDEDALVRLGPLVEALLTHDRTIVLPCDDSVVRVVDGAVMPIRRSRGYAPLPIRLGFDAPPTLAVGAELKNTFCIARGGHAWLSQHIGDMENLDTMETFGSAVDHLCALYRLTPEVIAADSHPGYMTGTWARRSYAANRVTSVQHHHAHIVSALIEHGLDPARPVLGFAFDGTGLGTDGSIWGGEVLRASAGECSRLMHLRPVPLPGGDSATRHPHRIALAHLWAAGIAWADDIDAVAATPERERALLARQLETGFRCTPTTSMGRLFDAVASLLGVRHHISYEAQAAIELEGLASRAASTVPLYDFGLDLGAGPDRLGTFDAAPVLHAVVADCRRRVPVVDIAAGFHAAVARVITRCAVAFSDPGDAVLLSGGVFQNAVLLRQSCAMVRDAGRMPLSHRVVPANDGGLALGQAVIAAWQAVRRDEAPAASNPTAPTSTIPKESPCASPFPA